VTYPLPSNIIYEFPEDTWVENLAVRHNGQIVVTENTRPRIYQVDPFMSQKAILLHEFPETPSILGIVETSPDVFHVCSANFSSETFQGFGGAYIFRLDMRRFHPDRPGSVGVSKIATIPQAQALNGLTFLGWNSILLLVSDFDLGVVFSVDIDTGESQIAINSTYSRSTGFGVNGLKVRHDVLYFTNSQQQTLVKVAINARGEAIGDYTVSAHGGFAPDDFAIDVQGNFYVAEYLQSKDGLVFVPRGGGAATYIAEIRGPTACAFGRTASDRDILYVSTSGGDYGHDTGKPVTVSGKIVKVNVGRRSPEV